MREKNNYKKIVIILGLGILLVIITASTILLPPIKSKQSNIKKQETNITVKEKKEELEQKKVEDKEEKSTTVDNKSEVSNTSKTSENNSSKSVEKIEIKRSEQKQEQPKVENTQPASQPVQQVQEQPQVVEQPKEQTDWEKYGVSEYDYYHKPMWSWARVDYRVEDYGTLEQTHQACIDEGFRLKELEQINSFTCNNINSYAGNYLGDMLKTR